MTRIATSLLGLLLAGGLVALAPATSAESDPVDCASLLVQPDVRPTLWNNTTEWRVYAVNGSVHAIRYANATANGTFAYLARDENASIRTPTVPNPMPAPGLAPKLDLLVEAAEHAIVTLPAATDCLDGSAGATDSFDDVLAEAGSFTRATIARADPLVPLVFETAREAECAVYEAAGLAPPSCADPEEGEDA